ncbi:hypothetical protein BKA70DRAFT_1479959 [Coprinopsis sp. MPI-PUGE-AT-0042]|nr:hypothetical protein BKA70DRAFT_1479959 [Coprinopsis sp. MPI-PUGE-AT-0042]
MQYDELVAQQDSWCIMKRSRRVMGVVREELHQQTEHLEAKNVKLTSELLYLQERNQSIKALREEKRGLETQLGGLDELREKVVRLEAGVEAGWLEREAWACKIQDANNTNNNATPSSVPISIIQPLTDLRFTHAHLLEEHGQPLLLCNSIRPSPLGAEVRAAKEGVRRKESRAMLVEREVGYLQALSRKPIAEHEQEINAQATKIDQPEQALFNLSAEIAGGRHVPPKTRILCMPENPDQAWADLRHATMDREWGLIRQLREGGFYEIPQVKEGGE